MITKVKVEDEEFVKNRDGVLVPIDQLRATDLRDDEIAESIIYAANRLQRDIEEFRDKVARYILRRQREALPDGLEVDDIELLSKSTELRSYDGGKLVMWIVEDKIRPNLNKLAACKAALEKILAQIDNKVARKSIATLLNMKSDRSVDRRRIAALRDLEIDIDGWEICLDELEKCFEPAGISMYPRCYDSHEGNLQLIPLRVSGGVIDL